MSTNAYPSLSVAILRSSDNRNPGYQDSDITFFNVVIIRRKVDGEGFKDQKL